jgi:DegV family protein with EDD domain
MNIHLLGVLDTLKYLALGGRIGRARALLGSVLNVKPLITIRNGEISPVGNVRTHAKAVEKLFEFVKGASNIQDLAIIHNTTPDDAISLKDRFSSFVKNDHLYMARLGPALGVHAGPGMLGVVIRTDDGNTESQEPVSSLFTRKITVPPLHLPKINLPSRR